MVSPYERPGGLPRGFLCTLFCCFAIDFGVHKNRADGKPSGENAALRLTLDNGALWSTSTPAVDKIAA